MNACVDLRSDTVTRPTPAMYEAMQRAPVGDDTYGEDPTVNALQARIAGMLGFEAAMFVSSGTQANLCAVLAHCGRGDEYIVGQMAHCYRWEAGGAAMFGGVQPQPLDHAEDGTLPLAAIADAIKPDNEHFAVTRLLALENTLGGDACPMRTLAPRLAWRGGTACRRTWMARACSTRPRPAMRRRPRPAHGASRGTSTPCRCASAKGWVRRSAARCAAVRPSLHGRGA
ncbi:Beta-eliminating lyase [compost metagenome]